MQRLIGFFMLSMVKIFSTIFYRLETKWLNRPPVSPWSSARLIVFLNHTSLFEPLYLQGLTFQYLWKLAGSMNVPGADITLNRPIVGRFWKLLLPNIVSVTRKNDGSWGQYMNTIKPDSIIMLAPEGRMKRPNGLDKYGKPMTVRGGVADIIEHLHEGGIILCFSGGLHHVQAPGQNLPRLFKRLKLNFTYLDIKEYKASLPESPRERKLAIVGDLQKRLEKDCPSV